MKLLTFRQTVFEKKNVFGSLETCPKRISAVVCVHIIFSGSVVEVMTQPRQQHTMVMMESVALSFS